MLVSSQFIQASPLKQEKSAKATLEKETEKKKLCFRAFKYVVDSSLVLLTSPYSRGYLHTIRLIAFALWHGTHKS